MKKENGYWIDDNGNMWDSAYYSEDEALTASKALIACIGCRNCHNCRDCSYCRYCSDCRDCHECHDCSDCRDCHECHDCSDCRDCSDCSGFKDNPMRYIHKRIGSRNDNPSVYWLGDSVQCVVGCFRGNLDELKVKVKETHKDNKKYYDEYMEFIRIANLIIKD